VATRFVALSEALALLGEARDAIEGELRAAGLDEVRQHPALRTRARLVRRIDDLMQRSRLPDLTPKDRRICTQVLLATAGDRPASPPSKQACRRVAGKLTTRQPPPRECPACHAQVSPCRPSKGAALARHACPHGRRCRGEGTRGGCKACATVRVLERTQTTGEA
jgi:hypothetical protein